METRLYEIGEVALISVAAVAIMFRTPFAGYMTGSQKIFGIV